MHVDMQRVRPVTKRRDPVTFCHCGDYWIVSNGSSRVQLMKGSSSPLATLVFPATVLCCSESSSHHTTILVCLVDGRVLSLSLDQVLTDLKSPSANDIGEDIFESLLGSPDVVSDQNTPQSIHVDHHCTVVTRFNCNQYVPSLLMMTGDILLLCLQSKVFPKKKSATCINGYLLFSHKSSEYFHSFTITSEFYCPSMIVIHSGCSEAGTAGTSVDDYLLASFFGPDVALSKCPLLLYGTSAGQIFYVSLSVQNKSSRASDLKSHLLLSLNQAIMGIFVVQVCQGLVNLLVFVGKEGKVCFLASYDKQNCFKEVCLNLSVYAACFVGSKLLLSSYCEITVLNFDFKCDKNKESFCLNTALSSAFSDVNTIKISGVVRMCVDTKRTTVIMGKRNGHIYTVDESYFTNYSAVKGNDLQKAVTQVCEISKKVDELKDNLKMTEISLKEVNSVIAIIRDLDVGIGSVKESLFSCQFLPKVYYKDIGVELHLSYHKTLILSDSWYICVCFTFPKFHHQLCFSLSGINGGNTITHFMKLAEKSLPFHIKCVLCHAANGTRAPVGVSVVLKQETFDVLKFVKVLDKGLLQTSPSTIKGCLRVSKNSLKQLEDNINTDDIEVVNCLFSCGGSTRLAPVARGQSAFQDSSVISKAGDSAIAHLYKTIQEDHVVINLLSNSPSFICELRAAIFERIKIFRSEASSFLNCTPQMRSLIMSILNQLQQFRDLMNEPVLDREKLAKELFGIYQQLHKF